MSLHQEQVKQKLTPKNVESFLAAFDSDTVTSPVLLEIASKISMGLRETMQRIIDTNGFLERTTGWNFLDCWYLQDPATMDINHLIAALQSKDVQLVELAEKIMLTRRYQINYGGIKLVSRMEGVAKDIRRRSQSNLRASQECSL